MTGMVQHTPGIDDVEGSERGRCEVEHVSFHNTIGGAARCVPAQQILCRSDAVGVNVDSDGFPCTETKRSEGMEV